MSLNVSILPDIEAIENLPQYCNYHRFLLVEELLLVDDYSSLHYGKCRLIGRVFAAPNEIYLENIEIPNIPEECALTEGTLQIRLHATAASASIFPTLEHGKYFEILGEVILLSNSNNPDRENLTSRGVVERMQSPLKPENKQNLMQYFKKHYKPAVNVWFVSQINEAPELISRNLEVRMLESISLQ
ncbi:uncharacterized protein LOC133329626 [Musca vetustissima]|uniref:uncharacterized protein LOC133329626 n=1 Tax=Musca vetustissima TaxID=27455 RepID=UPI002AB78934|nr:uncharacterized protein LOC133329626 [Musca vetustissima]